MALEKRLPRIVQTRVGNLTEVGTPLVLDAQDCEGVFVGTAKSAGSAPQILPPISLTVTFLIIPVLAGQMQESPAGPGE